MKITTKLTLLFLLLAIAPLMVVGYLAYAGGRQAIEQDTQNRLISTNIYKTDQFERWLENDKRHLRALAQRPLVKAETANLVSLNPADPAYKTAYRKILANHLTPAIVEAGSFLNLSIIRASDGLILVSTDSRLEGKYRESEPFFVAGRQDTFVGNVGYSLSQQEVTMHISTPLRDEQDRVIAVLTGHANLDEMSGIMSRRSGLSASEDTYLVNSFNFFVTEPQFGQQDSVLSKSVHTAGVAGCLAQHNGVDFYNDYRGVPVIGAYNWLPERELCILTEVDQAEAFAPIQQLNKATVGIGVLVAGVVIAMAVVFARTITAPIQELIKGTEAVAGGNLDYRIKVSSRDEIGHLAGAFNQMAARRAHMEDELQRAHDELELRVQERTVALSRSEEKYRQLAETAHDIILTHDLDGNITYINRAGLEISRYSREEIYQLSISAIVNPDELEKMQERKQKRLNGDTSIYRFETELITKNNQRVPLEVVSSLLGSNGKPDGILVLARNITERKQAEEKLREIDARHAAMIENIGDVIAIVEADGTTKYQSPNIEKWFGWKPEDLIGTNGWDKMHPEDVERIQKEFSELLKKETASVVEYRFKCKDGNYKWIELTAVNRINEPAINGVLLNYHDITERKQAEEALAHQSQELIRSNTELQQFAYVASHDLQEPLRMVSSYVQLLARRYQGQLDADADEFIGFAVDGANRMKTLIDDLLAYSRVGTRGKTFNPTACEVVLEQVLTNLQLAIAESGAVVTHDPLPTVTADESQLSQLFQNLIGNGLKFRTEAPPEIHVGVERMADESHWLFSVSDNGIGLEPQYAERIFVIFQRLHNRGAYAGTGIGLAVCKKIVERHGGRIWVESKPGAGSTFYFTIPATGV